MMPRKRKSEENEEMVLISLYVPKHVIEKIDDLVRQGAFKSRSEFIREAIEEYLEDLEEEPEPVFGPFFEE
jgi:Arc/MetJ-type ribon-helix-helix transcriptional regulator